MRIAAVLRRGVAACLVGTHLAAGSAHAQRQDSLRVRTDSSTRSALIDSTGKPGKKPPISPRRAFLTSLLLPGYGQTRLDRGSAGALFAAVELGAVGMLRQSVVQLHEARRFRNDSIPTEFTVNSDGAIVPSSLSTGGFNAGLIRSRRLHVEDWLAALAFNHLIAGADAFVSAILWDLDSVVSVVPVSTSHGRFMLVATISF